MTNRRIGKLPKRYSFILNKYPKERLSKCPLCCQATFSRKFAMFIHIVNWGPMILGKTCKYCAKCELIIAHQSELEYEIDHSLHEVAPEIIRNKYFVVGTVEKKIWQQGLKSNSQRFEEILKHMADFKKLYDLKVDPGGWYPAKEEMKSR